VLLCWRLGREEIVRPRRQWLGLLRGPSASPLDGMFGAIRRLLGFGPPVRSKRRSERDPHLFIYVKIPGDIQPIARGERFEDPLEAALRAAALGEVSGGGSQMDDPYPDGSPRVEFCGIDVEVVDRDQARRLLRQKLIELGAPSGTELHYTQEGSMLLDRFINGLWIEAVPRTATHPGLGF